MRGEDQQSVNRAAELKSSATRKKASLALTALLAAVAGGFFAGTRQEWPKEAGYAPPAVPSGAGVRAPSYAELREQGLSPNTQIYQASRAALIGLLPRPTDSVPPRSAEARAQVLARRAKGRAFDGAPPSIPHPIATRAEPNCLVCHEHGAQIATLRAPKMSHQLLQNCPQCHAEGFVQEPMAPGPAIAENDFRALPFGGQGARAWRGAPPVVPHRGFMRQRCDSCHGVAGALGLRTPHADRQSCMQCHVFDADSDQGSFFSALRVRADVP